MKDVLREHQILTKMRVVNFVKIVIVFYIVKNFAA